MAMTCYSDNNTQISKLYAAAVDNAVADCSVSYLNHSKFSGLCKG